MLSKKIVFLLIIEIRMCNPNGDPNEENKPRVVFIDKYGLISAESIKRLIRDEIEYNYTGSILLVRRDDSPSCTMKDRFYAAKEIKQAIKDKDIAMIKAIACRSWWDVRAFGEVFTEENANPSDIKKPDEIRTESFHITGPVTLWDAVSVAPIELVDIPITASFNRNEKGTTPESGSIGGKRTIVKHGVYVCKGSINTRDAKKTGFSDEDAILLIDALKNLFTEKSSASKPEGSRVLNKLIVWKQSTIGEVSPEKLFNSVHIKVKDGINQPESIDDYDISIGDVGVETVLYPKDAN